MCLECSLPKLAFNLTILNTVQHNRTEGDQGDTAGEESGVEAIGVKFRRRETEKMEERRKKSHAFLVKKQEEEPWTELKFKSMGHKVTVESLKRVFTGIKIEGLSGGLQKLDREEYVKSLTPAAGVGPPRSKLQPELNFFLGPLARKEIQGLPLQSAVEEIIKRVR